jgi:hypothetical protein
MQETRASVLEAALKLTDSSGNRTIAKALHQRYPELFPTLESARSAIRAELGAIGERSRVQITEPKLSSIAEGLAKLKAQPEDDDLSITILEGKVGILPDVHIPYHDTPALTTAVEHLSGAGITDLILNGDQIDFYGISRFTREIGRMTVQQEIRELYGYLSFLRDTFPKVRIIYKMGNHEERLRAYLLNQAKDIADLDALKFENISGCKDLGIEVVKRNRIMCGSLSVLHGHELPHGIAAPVNPARGVYLRAKSSTIVGHHHQVSHHQESDLNGKRTGCWSMGCLCRLNPDYNNFAFLKWSHGFASVEVDGQAFHVSNHTILDGRVL